MKKPSGIWIIVLALVGAILCLVVFAMVWPTGAEWEARGIAQAVRQFVSESELTSYLAACERDIQRGILSPTNCVPAWLKTIECNHRKYGQGSYLKGTNLEIFVAWIDGRGGVGVRIGNIPESHVPHADSTRLIHVHTNCSVWFSIRD
jgi:hypothetical protein